MKFLRGFFIWGGEREREGLQLLRLTSLSYRCEIFEIEIP